MPQTLITDFPQDLQDKLQIELASLPSYDLMLSILNKIHLATDKIMGDIPLYALYLLLLIAQDKKMDKAIAVIEKEIELNLEAGRLADEAQQWAQEQKKLADEAEQLAKQVRTLRLSIENRLNAQN